MTGYSETDSQLLEFSFNAGKAIVRVNGTQALEKSGVSGNQKLSQIGLKWVSNSSIVTWAGNIMEIVAMTGISDRLKIESYLAHKWGLQNNLPAGHIYKDRTPINSPKELDVSADITGLVKRNTYYYRIKAKNSEDTDWADTTSSFVSEQDTTRLRRTDFYTDPPVLWRASDGTGGNGQLQNLSWTDAQNKTVQYKVAKFSFGQINIGDGVKINLIGSNPIHLDVERNATILSDLDASAHISSNTSVLGGGLGGTTSQLV